MESLTNSALASSSLSPSSLVSFLNSDSSVVDLLTPSEDRRLRRRYRRRRGQARVEELRWYDGEGFRIEDNDEVLWRPEGYTPHLLDDDPFSGNGKKASKESNEIRRVEHFDESTKKISSLRPSKSRGESGLLGRLRSNMSSLATALSVLAIPAALAAAYWLFVTNGPTPVVRARNADDPEDLANLGVDLLHKVLNRLVKALEENQQ